VHDDASRNIGDIASARYADIIIACSCKLRQRSGEFTAESVAEIPKYTEKYFTGMCNTCNLSLSLSLSPAHANFRGVLALLGALTKLPLALDRAFIPTLAGGTLRFNDQHALRMRHGARFRRDSRVASRRRNRSDGAYK